MGGVVVPVRNTLAIASLPLSLLLLLAPAFPAPAAKDRPAPVATVEDVTAPDSNALATCDAPASPSEAEARR
jgi:hypothetical protein